MFSSILCSDIINSILALSYDVVIYLAEFSYNSFIEKIKDNCNSYILKMFTHLKYSSPILWITQKNKGLKFNWPTWLYICLTYEDYQSFQNRLIQTILMAQEAKYIVKRMKRMQFYTKLIHSHMNSLIYQVRFRLKKGDNKINKRLK